MFSGDPLDFQLFMQAIKHNIEDKTDSNEDRLYFLEQYTVGQPKELVRSCLHMDAATGYAEAKRLLKRHFGDDFKITTAYIEKALNWSLIKPDDGKALNSYALYLRSCSNAARNLQYMSELDSPSNMKQIITKLPYKLRERWRSVVCDIMEQTQQRPKFNDLVIFIEKQSKIMQDPVFGDIQDARRESKVRLPTANSPYRKSASKQSFVTAVSPVTTNAAVVNTKVKDIDQINANDAFSIPCFFCQRDHAMETCETMSKLPHEEKVKFLKRHGFCFACLIKGHLSKMCKRRLTCRSCDKKHPTLLHIENCPSGSTRDVKNQQTTPAVVLLFKPTHSQ